MHLSQPGDSWKFPCILQIQLDEQDKFLDCISHVHVIGVDMHSQTVYMLLVLSVMEQRLISYMITIDML